MKGIMKKDDPRQDSSSPIVSMIFTHQARMRCFVRKTIQPIVGTMQKGSIVGTLNDVDDDNEDDYDSEDEFEALGGPNEIVNVDRDDDELTTREAIFERPDYLDDYEKLPTGDKHDGYQTEVILGGGKGFSLPRFKNGSVLEYVITSDAINIRLLIDGEVDEKKEKYIYYVLPGDEFKDIGAVQGRYNVTPFNPIKLQNNTYQVAPGQKYIFYVVRHGQATHNLLKSKMEKLGNVLTGKKDTSLTDEGKQQARRSGAKMASLLKNESVLAPGHLFSSDLKRTRETATNFITGLLNNIDEASADYKKIADVSDKHSLIVLPCAHELAFIKSGNCDAEQAMLPTPPENQTSCSLSNRDCNYEGHFDVNWDEYYRFYGSSTRSKMCKTCGRRRCKDTDMVTEAIRIINDQTGMNTVRPIRFAQGTKRTDGLKTRQGTWMSNPYGGKRGKNTMRRRKNKTRKTRKSHNRKRITRSKPEKSHKKVKNTKKSRK